ncbi:MAG: hypothetical protein IPP49_12175 [Saprospiraceae bacterium]|nr:hypothetical protein [Saprospiraceae bacterium]
MNDDLDIKRKKIKPGGEQMAVSVMDQNKEMQKILKEIKHSKDEEKPYKPQSSTQEKTRRCSP